MTELIVMNLKFINILKLLIIIKIIKISFIIRNSFNIININKLNDKIILVITIIIIITILISIKKKKNLLNKIIIENQNLEIIWTLFPILIILIISYISIIVLYINREIKSNILSIKITGNQWFWNYSYININIKFNSYILIKHKFRFNLIDTDFKLIVPFNIQVMLIVSSIDVIHSWTIPSLNIKIDAIPGQVNNSSIKINKITIIFGQCSEICGINHRFIPIIIESITIKNFILWIKKNK